LAHGGRESAIVIGFAAGILFVAAAVLGGLWLHARAQLAHALNDSAKAERDHAGIAAMLDTIPMTGFHWRSDGEKQGPGPGMLGGAAADPRANTAYADFIASLEPVAAGRLASAVAELQQTGKAFDANVTTAGGSSAYDISGRPASSGASVLWVTDASAMHMAEAKQRGAAAAAASLREALDATPLPMWRRDNDLKLIDCNLAYAAALDTDRAGALADGRELAPASGRHRALALARAAATGKTQTERRHVVIAGSRRMLEVTETPLPNGGTLGFAVDRTDLETAESELSRHINAHGEVLEHIHAAVAIYGADKRLKFFNSAFSELWGIENEWLNGEPSLDELLERLRERRRIPELADFRIFKRQQLGMFTSLIEPLNELMHLPDGRTLSVSVSPHPLGGLIFVYEDVTDRLALERSYNTLTEVQRETLDNAFEGIAVFGSDGRLKLHNPAYRKIWSLSPAHLTGEPHISEIIEKTRAFYDAGGDPEQWVELKEQVIARITAHTQTSDLLDRSDGSVLQTATVPLPDGNVLLTCLDVTDTARVERALRERNEALETAGRLKSEFIANVSYELRTPLNAIIGFAEILANQYFGTLNARQLDYSRGILDSSHRLMSLINDILDLATIEAGYMALETDRVDIREMLDSVMTLTRERARNQNLSLSLSCPPDIGAIEADERRLKQALFNLISNAIKFTPARGSIVLEAQRNDDGLVLNVADTGVGIPAADQARVFEKFERGNPQARESGAGLGLSLVKSLIELHGGSVSIDSAPGRGTMISCRLPDNAIPQAELRAAPDPVTIAQSAE
jgi:signal transduction histidine kinase